MKTSDKILIGLIVALFTVPFLFAYTIKGKIKRGEYTVEKFEQQEKNVDNHSGSFGAFKAVKVIGPGPELLRCYLKQSNQMKYEYNNYWKQNVEIVNTNDTLVITYKPTGKEMHDLFIKLSLPDFNTLTVDGATVLLDSVGTSGNLNVTLKNNGIIRDETKGRDQQVQVGQTQAKKEPIALLEVNDKASNSDVKSPSIKIPHTDLDIREILLYPLLERI